MIHLELSIQFETVSIIGICHHSPHFLELKRNSPSNIELPLSCKAVSNEFQCSNIEIVLLMLTFMAPLPYNIEIIGYLTHKNEK